jgi:hypothetical protein
MIQVVHPGSRIRILTFYPSRIPGPGIKKAPDPGSGSATLTLTSVADPGCLSRIADLNCLHPGSQIQGQKDSGSRIRIEEFKYF